MSLIPQLTKALSDSISSLGLEPRQINLSPPNNPQFGDLSTNLPLILAKQTQKNPMEIAKNIKNCLNVDSSIVGEVTITPPGFINFLISPGYYYKVLRKILTDTNYGRSKTGAGKTANVEFVSANPTGPLTVGHGRQAVLGDIAASILEWNGYKVTREYYYNDAGRQMRILGKSVEARYYQLSGQNSPLPKDGYQGNYIIEIAKKIKATHGNALKADDPFFLKVAEESIFADIIESLKKLGIHHDKFSNEKTYYESGAIEQIVKDLKAKNLVYEADGATWFRTTDLGMEKDRVLIKSSGEPTYRLPDMAYHRDKLERGFDLVVDIFGADHADTYPDILAALKVLEYDTNQVRVLIHQFVTLIKGGEKVKMSTRKAEFVTLDELTEQAGIDIVRYFFIMRGMNSHLNFDLDLAVDQSDKNPVFYLQYAHARICNIIKHGETLGQTSSANYNPTLLNHSSELELLKNLEQFPSTIEAALDSLEPQSIANYLQSSATCFHKFYSACRVITKDTELSKARLALVMATKCVLANGLSLLGLRAPERM